MSEKVILVDKDDNPLGQMDKLEAHQKGMLHRAFSIFVLNSSGEFLLQRRALDKYHSGGLWTNTCCSHPRPGEDIIKAAERRLMEEMGMHCELLHAFSFIYEVRFANGLTEHELDHIFFGWSDAAPVLNKEEVAEWKHVPYEQICMDIKKNPSDYTEWFKMSIDKIFNHINSIKK